MYLPDYFLDWRLVGLRVNYSRLSIFVVIVLAWVGVLSANVLVAAQSNWLYGPTIELMDAPTCGAAEIWFDTDHDGWACSLLNTSWEFWGDPLYVSGGIMNAPPDCTHCEATIFINMEEPVTFTSIYTARAAGGEGHSIDSRPSDGQDDALLSAFFPSLHSVTARFVPSDVYTSTAPSLKKELQIPNDYLGEIYLVPKWKINFHILAFYREDGETQSSDNRLKKYDRIAYGIPYVTIEAVDWKFDEALIPLEDVPWLEDIPRRVSDAQS